MRADYRLQLLVAQITWRHRVIIERGHDKDFNHLAQIKQQLDIIKRDSLDIGTWLENSTLTDYIFSPDISMFLIGYQLLVQQGIINDEK